MKRILFLLLLTVSVYGQNPSRFAKIQITGNSNSVTATKVNVQEANGEVNTQTINTGFNKNIGLGGSDVVGANTLLNQYSTTPVDWIATAFNSGQVVFYVGKQWISKTTTVAGDVPSVSSKWDEITFEALANKTTTVDQTIIDGSTNSVSGNAVFDGLALKSNIGHTHVASQITDLSKASVGLGNVDNTSDLSKPLSTATQTALNGKENAFSKNTAFNKPFGITAGTVVEGGTLGSNAYNSTAYLPLTGGTLSGYLNLNDGIALVLGDESTSRLRFITSNGVNYIQSGTGSGYGTRADLVITGNYGGNETVRFKADGTTIFSNSLTATSFIKSSAPTTNLLLAGGGDIAQSTFQPAITGLTTNYLPKWNGSGFVNSLVYDNGVNIGIGTILPSSKFEVNSGDIKISQVIGLPNTAGYGLTFRNVFNSNIYDAQIVCRTNAGGAATSGLLFRTGYFNGSIATQADRMYIDAETGNVIIGTTTDNLVAKLQVNGNITASPATTANQVPTWGQVQAAARPYKVYTAVLTQQNTDAPSAVVLENTLGGTVVWTRNATGNYYGTLNGAFPIYNKIALFQGGSMWGTLPLEIIRVQYLNSNTIQIITQQATDGALVDSSLSGTSIEIRVYN